jgi:hypothetical protein
VLIGVHESQPSRNVASEFSEARCLTTGLRRVNEPSVQLAIDPLLSEGQRMSTESW